MKEEWLVEDLDKARRSKPQQIGEFWKFFNEMILSQMLKPTDLNKYPITD